LTLAGAERERPTLDEMLEKEKAEKGPRESLFQSVLSCDMLDARFLRNAPLIRRTLYKFIPAFWAQFIEASFVRKRYDAIITWSEHLSLPYAGFAKLTRSRTPHFVIGYWVSDPKKTRLYRLVQSHIDGLFLMNSTQIDFAREFLRDGEKKVVPLRWFVDQKFWRPMNADTCNMISSCGREYRDYVTLVRALRNSSIDCHISAKITPGKNDAWIDGLRKEMPLPVNVSIRYDETLQEIRDIYARSRFVVVPLLPNENAVGSTVILEAMAMGKPVICSKIEGHKDLIRDGVNGIFVKPEDPRALREAIEHLWTNPAKCNAMGLEYHTLDEWVGAIKGHVESHLQRVRESG
jgi:glycosyltransferase involved in cell wall biosynthesis